MTEDADHIQILQSARHVARAVEKARTKQLDMPMVAVEMLKTGLSLLTGVPQEQCADPVREMLRLYGASARGKQPMTLVTEPGDALTRGIPIGEPERSAMLQLLGQAVARFHNPASLAATERDALNQLIGLLCARLHEAALAQRLAYLEYQIADLQRQLTRHTN